MTESQIITKTKELLGGCKKECRYFTRYKWYSKKYTLNICGTEGFICEECKAQIKGRLDSQKDELFFLKELISVDLIKRYHNRLPIRLVERITELKESIKLIEKAI